MAGAPGLAFGPVLKRAGSPPRPLDAIEPISPTSPTHIPRNDSSSRRRHGASLNRTTRADRPTHISKVTYGANQEVIMQDILRGLRVYKRRRASYAQPQQSPIESLATIALARDQPYKSPSTLKFPQKSSPQLPHDWQQGHQPVKHPAPYNQYHELSQPLTKRARSEFSASPQQTTENSRPATSYYAPGGWGYNLEQAIDNGTRMGQQQRPTSSHTRQPVSSALASDAELLLGFSRSARTPSVSTSRDQPSPSFVPATISPLQSRLPTTASQSQVVAIRSPPQTHIAQPTATLQTQSASPQPPQHSPVSNPKNGQLESINLEEKEQPQPQPAVQTHTPPEEKDSAPEDQKASGETPEDSEEQTKGQADVVAEDANNTARVVISVTDGEGDEVDLIREEVPPNKVKDHVQKDTQESHDQLQSPLSLAAEQGLDGSPKTTTAKLIESAIRTRRFSESQLGGPAVESHLQPPSTTTRAVSVPLKEPEIPNTTATLAENHDPTPTTETNTPDICAACKSPQNSPVDDNRVNWIHCSGCKSWFHFTCAGIKTDKEAKTVDKFFCSTCTPVHGKTTCKSRIDNVRKRPADQRSDVRKSLRAHNDVDYASLNMGVIRTSDENPEHHWIKAIKNGTLRFKAESFARLGPEIATAEFFEKTGGWTEPVVIPATMNPRPKPIGQAEQSSASDSDDSSESAIWTNRQISKEFAPDDGQDMLDMVIPQGLTVRRVAELHGPNQQLDVIDVKAQDSSTRMTLQKWADYYESDDPYKPIRNVISLEVSQSKLGRLIRRPQVVRDLDLQDSVWPATENGKANPRVSVAFYCLMSVADCYTDFHIDFGGSSVYYHIVKGKKTFFFIPPTQKNLMKYQDWCNSESQSSTFLGNEVDDCFRVDLSEGDTMLIPAGWIHSVWTPEDSLVIGGNFLTRLNYHMQFRVVDVEKATNVPRKFRYPMFQKVMWYTLIKYLKEDPLPKSVEEKFYAGQQFQRETPTWREFDKTAANSELGTETYQARYYSKSELEGLQHLASFLFRTVMISMGRLEGMSQETIKAVTKSIPKGYGAPLDLIKTFAMWIAWKRGNEYIPEWAHPDAALPEQQDPAAAPQKKLTQAQLKRLERAAAVIPSQHSMRLRNGGEQPVGQSSSAASPAPSVGQVIKTPKTSVLGPKRVACDACRKRRIRCKHKDDDPAGPNLPTSESSTPIQNGTGSVSGVTGSESGTPWETSAMVGMVLPLPATSPSAPAPSTMQVSEPDLADFTAAPTDIQTPTIPTLGTSTPQAALTDGEKKGRSQACNTCRRSKVSPAYIRISNRLSKVPLISMVASMYTQS